MNTTTLRRWFATAWPTEPLDVDLWANALGAVPSGDLDEALALWHAENTAAPRPADIAGTMRRIRTRAAELEERRRADAARRVAVTQIRERLAESRKSPRPWELGLNRPTIESEAS